MWRYVHKIQTNIRYNESKTNLRVDGDEGKVRSALVHVCEGTGVSFVLDVVAHTCTAVCKIQVDGKGAICAVCHCLFYQRADFIKPLVSMCHEGVRWRMGEMGESISQEGKDFIRFLVHTRQFLDGGVSS